VAEKLVNDATKLLESLVYQLIVTLEQCYSLDKGQSLWLERYGDVTTEDDKQIEVKNFADELTDGHINFWNTLKNWLSPKFKQAKYNELILLTTQSFGVEANLRHWNELTVAQRIDFLAGVRDKTEARFQASGKTRRPKTLQAQDFIMTAPSDEHFKEVIAKVRIISNEPDLRSRANTMKNRSTVGVRTDKVDEYFDALLGFLISPELIISGCEVTHEQFGNRVASLFGRYHQNSTVFPRIERKEIVSRIDESLFSSRLFVKKLHEIEHFTAVSNAIVHHVIADHILIEELKSFTIDKDDIEEYKDDHRQRHLSLRDMAARRCNQVAPEYRMDECKNFYGERLGEQALEKFASYDKVSTEFRNGIYHHLADEEDEPGKEPFRWRLW
jgi:hypothetical protein